MAVLFFCIFFMILYIRKPTAVPIVFSITSSISVVLSRKSCTVSMNTDMIQPHRIVFLILLLYRYASRKPMGTKTPIFPTTLKIKSLRPLRELNIARNCKIIIRKGISSIAFAPTLTIKVCVKSMMRYIKSPAAAISYKADV